MLDVCCVIGCGKRAHACGFCANCYARVRQGIHPTRERKTGAHFGLSVKDRFYKWVDKSEDPNGCWLWKGFVDSRGYGMFSFTIDKKRRTKPSHRASWEFENGPIPEGKIMRHKCDVKLCIRPDHLEIGTLAENTNDVHERIPIRYRLGTDHGGSKINDEIVREIRSSKESKFDLAVRFNISPATVYQVRKRITWKHVT